MSTGAIVADALLLDEAQPQPDETVGPLYEAAARCELSLRFCAENGHPLDLDQVRCEICGAPGVWEETVPRGRVLASIIMHRIEASLVRAAQPYAVFDIETQSGHRLYLAASEPGAPPLPVGTEIDIGWVRIGARAVPRVVTHHPPRSNS
jgi:hypothetical protein